MSRLTTTGLMLIATLALALGCQSTDAAPAAASPAPAASTAVTVSAIAAPTATPAVASPFDKPGFHTSIDEVSGRNVLWVLKPDQKKSNLNIRMIGAGPMGMTIIALDNQTALEYLAAKDGFTTDVQYVNDRPMLWVLKPGQQKSNLNNRMIGAGPGNMTIVTLDAQTALEYLAAKPGFTTEVQMVNDRPALWVLKPGQQKSNLNVRMIGAGPANMTIIALDNQTALEYLAAKPGFVTEVQMADDRPMLWVLKPGEQRSNLNVRMIGAGPRGMTIVGVERETLEAYRAARG